MQRGLMDKELARLPPARPKPVLHLQRVLPGVLPRLHQSYDTTFQRLIGEFQTIWSYLTSHQGRAPVVVLFARLGGTGRFALRIAFLMWAGHVHDYSVWADLVAPVRNKRAKCELH